MLGAKFNGSMLRASTDDNYIELGWYERLIVDAWPYNAEQPYVRGDSTVSPR